MMTWHSLLSSVKYKCDIFTSYVDSLFTKLSRKARSSFPSLLSKTLESVLSYILSSLPGQKRELTYDTIL